MGDTWINPADDGRAAPGNAATRELESVISYFFFDSVLKNKTDITALETFDLLMAVYDNLNNMPPADTSAMWESFQRYYKRHEDRLACTGAAH